MALIDRNSNNYQPGAEWANGIRSLGSVLTQMPAIRAMAAQRGAMANYQNAHAGYENAATDEANARTGLINSQKDNEDNTAQGHMQFAGALKRLAINPNDTDALGDAFEGAGKGFKTDPENTMKAVGLLLSQTLARNGSTNVNQMAELQGGAPALAVANANNDARAQLPANNQVVIPTGGTLASRLTGQPLTEGGVTLKPGEQRFAPVATDDGSSGQPEDSVSPLPSTSTPQAQVTRNQLASALLRAAQQPGSSLNPTNIPAVLKQFDSMTAPPAAAQPAAATAPAMVRVQHPNGQTGMIPAANLPAALQAGYTQIGQ